MQSIAINRVISALNSALGSSYSVTQIPDCKNRTSSDIDAIAEEAGRPPLAIEHTRIESLAEQTRDSRWYMDVFGPLEKKLDGKFPFWLSLIVPYKNVGRGHDWEKIRSSLTKWLLAHAGGLPTGNSAHQIPGVPFSITTSKWEDLPHRFSLSRFTPPGEIEEHILPQMHKALDHKHDVLGNYRLNGALGILVLDSQDFVLVSLPTIYQAYVRAIKERPRINHDQVWLVQNFFDNPGVYCFDGPKSVMDAANPPNFHFGKQYEEEWLID